MGHGRRLLKNLFSKSNYVRLSAMALSGSATILALYSMKRSYGNALPPNCNEERQYVFPIDPGELSDFFKMHMLRWWPEDLFVKPIAWQLFEDIQKSIDTINDDAIQKLVKFSHRLDSDCSKYSSCMSLKTAIALARYGADPSLFPCSSRFYVKDSKEYYPNRFRCIFSKLPKYNIHPNLDFLITTTLKMYDDGSLLYYSGFESEGSLSSSHKRTMEEEEFLKVCLQGVVSHSRIYDSLNELLSLGILEILSIISRDYNDQPDILSLVCKILGNLACNASSSEPILKSGCLKILAEQSKSPHVSVRLPAKRALHNLDRRGNYPILPPGVYQLHPEVGCDDCSYDYDVVFIHGLLGGISRTWRQHDLDSNTTDASEYDQHQQEIVEDTPRSLWKSRLARLRKKSLFSLTHKWIDEWLDFFSDDKISYPTRKLNDKGELQIHYEEVPLELEEAEMESTQCWPNDWLPKDCPRARIIGVDFESFFSRWTNIYPVETTERNMSDRSAELLKKFRAIGIGMRPVVWVCHSMGGILLKGILCQANESPDPALKSICSNTKGVVFCSVPHLGTEMGALNTAHRFLLLPTEEIEELSSDSPQLLELNKCFIKLIEKCNLNILSYGEMLETDTGFGIKLKLVSLESADIGYGEFYPLRVDHLGTCKPWSRGSFVYRKTVNFIKRVVGLENKRSRF